MLVVCKYTNAYLRYLILIFESLLYNHIFSLETVIINLQCFDNSIVLNTKEILFLLYFQSAV